MYVARRALRSFVVRRFAISPRRGSPQKVVRGLRLSRAGVLLAAAALVQVSLSGCAARRAAIDPAFAARTYTPARIAVLPPTVFMVLDDTGTNDPRASAALSQQVAAQAVPFIEAALRRRGYDVSLAARLDGIYAADGQMLVSAQEVGSLLNGAVQYANSEDAKPEGPIKRAAFVAPELAARVGWATSSDALLYVNLKGVAVSSGKRTTQIIGALFIVFIIAAIVLIAMSSKGGGGHSSGGSSHTAARGIRAAPAGGGGVVAAAPAAAPSVGGGGGWRGPTGHGSPPPPPARYPTYYGGGPQVGVNVIVPLNGPEVTQQGMVEDSDEPFAGDDIRASMTLISARDGRVIWHLHDNFDVDPRKPPEVQAFIERVFAMLPPSLALGPNPGAAPPAPAPATPPTTVPAVAPAH